VVRVFRGSTQLLLFWFIRVHWRFPTPDNSFASRQQFPYKTGPVHAMNEDTNQDGFLNEPAGGYGNQRQYMYKVLPAAELRQKEIEQELKAAFRKFIEKRQIEVIIFERMPATDLAKAILDHPRILKPLLAACNLAGRAFRREIFGLPGLSGDTTLQAQITDI
jgi:hypothetical protein